MVLKAVHRAALRKLAVGTPAPLRDHITAHRSAGTDLTHAVWAEFSAAQRRLFVYRQSKLYAELRRVSRGDWGVSAATLSFPDVVRSVRLAAHLLAVYMLCVMWGRDSIMPLLSPASPFVAAIPFENPNWLPNHTERTHVDLQMK